MTRLSCCRRLPLFALLAFACVCRGAAGEVTVIAPTEPVPIGGFADVLIQGLEKPNSLVWQAYPTEPVRVTAAWGTTDPILSVPTHKARKVALWVAWLEGDTIGHQVIELVIGTPGPGPAPEPTPPPDPPEPEPVPSGKRWVLLVHESSENSPGFSQAVTLLRQPPHGPWMVSNGHSLSILDKDATDEHGKSAFATWQPHFADLALPAVLVLDKGTGKVVHKESLAEGFTAEDVIALLKGDE